MKSINDIILEKKDTRLKQIADKAKKIFDKIDKRGLHPTFKFGRDVDDYQTIMVSFPSSDCKAICTNEDKLKAYSELGKDLQDNYFMCMVGPMMGEATFYYFGEPNSEDEKVIVQANATKEKRFNVKMADYVEIKYYKD